jgi:hypothetical protein
MLWRKGWLETGFRLLFILGYTTLILFLQYSARNAAPPPHAKTAVFTLVMFSNPILVLVICAMLAGAGIVTQPALQATKGLHGSTLFTLSLPVSRLRLLAVRASIGWLEGVGVIGVFCWGMWLVSPVFRVSVTSVEMVEYAGTLISCGSALYFLSVLLATFLDDQWRAWGTMLASAALWLLSPRIPLPISVDIFRAMRDGSPLIAHTVPWTAIAFSLALAAVLFSAALKVAQTREY